MGWSDAYEETIQPSTISEETVSLAGKPARKKSNARNGTTKKTVRTDFGKIELDVPRDRAGSFDPERGNSEAMLRYFLVQGPNSGYR